MCFSLKTAYAYERVSTKDYWNKENHQTIGTRFDPRNQWVRVDNAHTAIINEDEVQLALARKTNGRKNSPISQANGSPWLPIAGNGH